MIESLVELLVELVVQIIGEVVFEFLVAMGWESLVEAGKPTRPESLLWTHVASFLTGCLAGALSALIVGRRVTSRSAIPGVSLVLAPIGTGLIMSRLGDSWEQRGRRRPVLFSFGAGAIFALGLALVRFVHIELHWRLF